MQRLRSLTIQATLLVSLVFILNAFNAAVCPAQQTQNTAAPAPSSRPNAGLFPLTVTVTDRKRNYVKGLLQGNFVVYDDKQEQPVAAFSSSDVPLSVGIIFDASASVKGERLKQARAALARFFQLSHKANEYFLIGFSTRPQLLQDWTRAPESLIEQLDAIHPFGNTALYDACYLGIAKVLTGRQPKRVLILISDGIDNESHYTHTELKRLLEESNVLFYSIGISGINDPGSSLGLEGQLILEELSSMTGANALFPASAKGFQASFDALAVELRNQYLIGFAPTAMDKKRHRLKIKVTLPPDAPLELQRLTVRSRASFYVNSGKR